MSYDSQLVMLFSALVSLMLTSGCLNEVEGVHGIAEYQDHREEVQGILTEREHEWNTESLRYVDVTKGRRVAYDGVHSKWLPCHGIWGEGRLPEAIEHGRRHLSLGTDITVSQ